MTYIPTAISLALASMLSLGSLRGAHAETPMFTDDAGTMDKGGKKIEGSLSKADTVRGLGLGVGFSPMDNVELGATLARARDSSVPVTANGQPCLPNGFLTRAAACPLA